MGRPKGLLLLRGEALLTHHVRSFQTVVSRVIVVLGSEAGAHEAVLPEGVEVVRSPRWQEEWPADSLRRALTTCAVRGPCLVTPVDVPPARPQTLRALLEAGAPAVPQSPGGADGHPVLLDAARVDQVKAAAPPGGLRTLLTTVPRVPVADEDASLDFDHPAAWQHWLGAHTAG